LLFSCSAGTSALDNAKEVIMPQAWSNKDERQYEHIKASEKKEGRSTKRAKEIAARTVNKGRSKEGRTKEH
jgi:3-hydroxy-3-methylglutaryl CoA synthase